MIHFITPYTPTKQIADVYNYYATLFDDNDWICYVDADSMFLNPFFGQQIEQVIKEHGNDYLAFTCMTNRVGNLTQCYGGMISENFDLKRHLKIDKFLSENHKTEVVEMSPNYPMSGVMILSKVETIKEIPFRGGGMLGVDNNFHIDIAGKGKLGLMKGVYLFHKYRAHNIHDKMHLK